MSRETVLARGRAAAEKGMVDSCVITRPGGTVSDKVTGQAVEVDVVTVYGADPLNRKCRIQQAPDQAASADNSGENYTLLSKRELQLPVLTSGDVRARDRVTITACPNDPSLVGKVFLVQDEAGKTDATARRLGIRIETP